VGTIYEDIDAAAAAIAGELTLHGYALDFSLESLAEVDRFFDENSALDPEDPDAAAGSLLASRLGHWMFALGAYSGEVLRRAIGGRWHWDGLDDDKAASTDTQLVLVDDSIVWPFQRAWKRLMNGPDDSMAAWGAEMVAAVRPEGPPA
jgi:hypothetical protein